MSNIDYSKEYVRLALSSEAIEPPDKEQANGTYEALTGLYMAHERAGKDGAANAWEVIKLLRPELSEMDKPSLLIHADELKNLSIPSYLLSNYPIYHKGFNVLVGKSGSGKSFAALDIAGRVAADAVCVYVAGEGVQGYSARWESWKHFHQLEHANLWFYTQALQVLNEAEIIEFFQLITDKVGKKPALLIIDTFARSAVGIDENSAQAVGEFIAAVDKMRFALDCAALIVHHTGKDGLMRGSTSLYGAADAVLSQNMNDGVIRLTNNPDFGGKNKYGSAEFDEFFRIVPHAAGGFDGGVLIPTERIESSEETTKLTKNQLTILEALEGYEEGLGANSIFEATEIARATGFRGLKQMMKSGHVSYANEIYTITELGKEALGGES
jgi:hypothetical protein